MRVMRGEPSQRTTLSGTKLTPFTFRVSASRPAMLLSWLSPESFGAGFTRLIDVSVVVPPPGEGDMTLIEADPVLARKEVGA